MMGNHALCPNVAPTIVGHQGGFADLIRSHKAPPPGQLNLAPSAGSQFFGQVDVDGLSEVMTVSLKDLKGDTLYRQTRNPEA